MSGRPLGLITATSLVMGSMIGSGIFLLPASLAEYGGISVLGWLCSAAGAMTLAWVFARFSQWKPGLGGPYFYAREGLGDLAGFLATWGYWISIWTGNAAIAISAVAYLGVFAPIVSETPLHAGVTAISLVWALTFVNLKGVRQAGRVQLVTTLLKAIPLLLLGLCGLVFVDSAQFVPFNRSGEPFLSAVAATTTLCLWAFLGLEAATIPSDSVNDPRRTIPRATIVGVVLVTGLYIAGSTVVLGVLPAQQLAGSTAPFSDAARVLWGQWAAYVMAAAAVFATLGALNGLILIGSQMSMAAARNGLFPDLFGRVSGAGVPAAGMCFSSILTSLLVASRYNSGLIGIFTFSILLSTIAVLVPYLLSASAALRLRRELGIGGSPLALVTVAIAFLFSMWAVGGAGQEAVYYGFLLLMTGLPVFAWQKSREVRRNAN